MKIGIIIPVRMSSKRLPGKVLKKINGKEIIKYIYERLKLTKIKDENIVFASSIDKSDDIIEEYCRNNSYQCFRGSKDDVAGRLLNCANNYNFDVFIRICGDNIFTDKGIIDSMIDIFKKGNYDIVTNVYERTFPFGISVEIIKTKFFEKMYPKMKTSSDKEHVTKYIYNNIRDYQIYNYRSGNEKYKNVKLALDTEKDFNTISKIINLFKKDHTKYNVEEIVNLYYLIK